MDNFEISLSKQVKRWTKIKSGWGKMHACVLGLKSSKGTLFNSHILDKRRRMNLGMKLTMEA